MLAEQGHLYIDTIGINITILSVVKYQSTNIVLSISLLYTYIFLYINIHTIACNQVKCGCVRQEMSSNVPNYHLR